MQKQYDSISFEYFDAREAQEPWAVEFGADKEPAIKIFINGRELNAWLVSLEDVFTNSTDTPPAMVYGHNPPSFLLKELTSPYADSYGASLNCCSDCGDEGCWGVRVKVTQTEDEVIWHDFVHEHRDYPYNLEFHFDKASYEEQLQALREFCALAKEN